MANFQLWCTRTRRCYENGFCGILERNSSSLPRNLVAGVLRRRVQFGNSRKGSPIHSGISCGNAFNSRGIPVKGAWLELSWSARSLKVKIKPTTRRAAAVSGVAASDGSFSSEQIPVKDGSVLTGDGSELRNTVRLVECAMLAATAGLVYFLSNLFRLESYVGCFFPLPVVISSMRWGAAAGRKTMLATAMLLMVLSGPLKAATYLLMHGFVGLAIGSLWRWRSNWVLSIAVCTLVRVVGSMGFVLLSSWLLKENLLRLITVNAHASISYILAALGINIIPSMVAIYFVFAGLLFINCASFVFLLHVLYAIFLKRLGIPTAIAIPRWVERAI